MFGKVTGFMADYPALPLWTDALAADTEHLTHQEYGLYQRMLNAAWRMPSCDLPNDAKWIMRRFRLSAVEYDDLCQPIIDEFWRVNAKGRLEQKRLKKEREFVSDKRKKQQARAKSRWDKEKDPCHGNAAPHASGNAPTPTPTDTLNPNGFNGAPTGVADPDAFLYSFGKQLLGKSSGGVISKLKAKFGLSGALERLQAAKGREDPMEYVQGCLRANPRGLEFDHL